MCVIRLKGLSSLFASIYKNSVSDVLSRYKSCKRLFIDFCTPCVSCQFIRRLVMLFKKTFIPDRNRVIEITRLFNLQ